MSVASLGDVAPASPLPPRTFTQHTQPKINYDDYSFPINPTAAAAATSGTSGSSGSGYLPAAPGTMSAPANTQQQQQAPSTPSSQAAAAAPAGGASLVPSSAGAKAVPRPNMASMVSPVMRKALGLGGSGGGSAAGTPTNNTNSSSGAAAAVASGGAGAGAGAGGQSLMQARVAQFQMAQADSGKDRVNERDATSKADRDRPLMGSLGEKMAGVLQSPSSSSAAAAK